MQPGHIKFFLTLAEAGSIRAAARLLNKSQSVLTRNLHQMEEEIGLALFRRTSRGIAPTETGMALLARARSVNAELDRFDQEVSELRGSASGNLRLCVSPLAAVNIIPYAIADFHNHYPDIDIALSSHLFGNALTAVREGQQDIIIGPYANAQDPGDLIYENLFTTEIVVVTSKHAAHADATTLAQLTNCYWAMMGNSMDGPRQRFKEQFTRHGIVAPRIRLSSESLSGLLSVIETMDAVCTFPHKILDLQRNARNIVRIPVKEKLEPLTVSMVTRAGKSLTPAGEKLADCIRQQAGRAVDAQAV